MKKVCEIFEIYLFGEFSFITIFFGINYFGTFRYKSKISKYNHLGNLKYHEERLEIC